MHNKVIVLCLANVVFTTSKFLHGDYKAILNDWLHKSGKPGSTQPRWNAQTPIKPKHVRNDCTVCWIPSIAPSPSLFSVTWKRHTWTLLTVLAFRITKENSRFPKLTKYESQTCDRWPFIVFNPCPSRDSQSRLPKVASSWVLDIFKDCGDSTTSLDNLLQCLTLSQ